MALLPTPNEFVTLEQARSLVPGKHKYLAIWRWARYGLKVKGRDERIYLRTKRFGRTLYTTCGWLAEFGQALVDADSDHFNVDGKLRRAKPSRVRLNSTNVERAIDTLQDAGIKD